MPIFAVHYVYSDRFVADRDTHRPAHRAWLSDLVESGVVLSSGPYPDGSGALLIFQSDDASTVRDLLTQDPFVREKLVDDVRAIEWLPVVGTFTS
ncbi:YciI family protein [Nocardia sp. NPDC049190]|uniref:YciI family protein n=1 Tax=Nocardia sp. NPDC049190 TaxID=3155650 RepID=UPI0033E4B9F1